MLNSTPITPLYGCHNHVTQLLQDSYNFAIERGTIRESSVLISKQLIPLDYGLLSRGTELYLLS